MSSIDLFNYNKELKKKKREVVSAATAAAAIRRNAGAESGGRSRIACVRRARPELGPAVSDVSPGGRCRWLSRKKQPPHLFILRHAQKVRFWKSKQARPGARNGCSDSPNCSEVCGLDVRGDMARARAIFRRHRGALPLPCFIFFIVP